MWDLRTLAKVNNEFEEKLRRERSEDDAEDVTRIMLDHDAYKRGRQAAGSGLL